MLVYDLWMLGHQTKCIGDRSQTSVDQHTSCHEQRFIQRCNCVHLCIAVVVDRYDSHARTSLQRPHEMGQRRAPTVGFMHVAIMSTHSSFRLIAMVLTLMSWTKTAAAASSSSLTGGLGGPGTYVLPWACRHTCLLVTRSQQYVITSGTYKAHSRPRHNKIKLAFAR
jgi:hypothetical protein